MPMSRPRRSAPRRIAAAVGTAGVLALALSGCVVAPAPTPTPSAPSSSEPIFASDEEALAAAVEAYEAYRAASAEISADGGAEAARILPFVSEEFASTVLDEFDALHELGLRMSGDSTIDTVSLASWTADRATAEVSIYLCRDVSGARAINSAGEDVTPPGRDDRVPLQAFLVSDGDDPRVLVVDGVDQWSGDDFCS